MTSELTEDSVFHGALPLLQPRRGYRFTEDAVYLAAFAARGGAVGRAIDLGAGCGVVGLCLLERGFADEVILLEIQRDFARLCRRNVGLCGLSRRAEVVAADLRSPPIASGVAELVVSNPPYLPLGKGLLPAHPERALARHEVSCTPADVARAAARLLTEAGRLVVVYPEARWEDARRAFSDQGLTIHRVRRVLPRPSSPPSLVLIEATTLDRGAPLREEPPLVAYDECGRRGGEVREILAGRWGDR